MKNDSKTPGDAADGQEVDVNDADVSAESERPRDSYVGRETGPPPLPRHVLQQIPSDVSQVPPAASYPPTPGRKRRPAFYAVLLFVFVVGGVAGGGVLAAPLRKALPAPAPSPAASVITIPTVDMDDDGPDSGP